MADRAPAKLTIASVVKHLGWESGATVYMRAPGGATFTLNLSGNDGERLWGIIATQHDAPATVYAWGASTKAGADESNDGDL